MNLYHIFKKLNPLKIKLFNLDKTNKYSEMYIEVSDLGQVKLVSNNKTRRIIVRYRNNEYQVTHPSSMNIPQIMDALDEMKPRILELRKRINKPYIFTNENKFKTLTFEVELIPNSLTNTYTTLKEGILTISYPKHIDINNDDFQSFVQQIVENTCRIEAKRILPDRVRMLAKKHNLEVANIKINSSKGRWGSCSSTKNINLSYYCMMLPQHLVDLVILHELCHTIEMNHGEKFWQLLDKLTNKQSKELTKELKCYKHHW